MLIAADDDDDDDDNDGAEAADAGNDDGDVVDAVEDVDDEDARSGEAPPTRGAARARASTSVLLSASDVATAAAPARVLPARPHVIVVDGAYTRTADLVALLHGTHPWLCAPPPPRSRRGDVQQEAAQAAVRVCRVVLTQQNLQLLRMLEMAQDVLSAAELRAVRVQLVTSAFSAEEFRTSVAHEREAFQSLAHAKATLTGTLLVDRAALRRTEAALERAQTHTHGRQTAATVALRRGGGGRAGAAAGTAAAERYRDLLDDNDGGGGGHDNNDDDATPLVVFDEREFRSTLPYELYSKGIDLVPLTLTTADYVLSDRYAVERKSVSDYNQSLQSGRIAQQLAALRRRYEYPICLIEFDRVAPFRLTCTTAWRSPRDGAAMAVLWARTARLMAANPRVSFFWARSPAHAASMLATLKRGPAAANVDPGDPMLTGSAMLELGSSGSGGGGGGGGGAASKELAHYAARVLSRLPGVTPSNAPRLMQTAGSLAGLATLTKAAMCAAMGEEHGEQLYTFVHEPFVESVDE